MKSGLTTSQKITRAYLDRIAAYDRGPFGFHAFITVADDAMAQAKAADDARAAGDTSELLGIPVAIKDLYDTKDMPTTDGSLAFEGWRPKRDAFQVDRLRDAGAVILGKANLSEFANSGSYSDSRLRHGLERLQAVQDVARLLRRLGRRDRAEPRRLRHGHADRRLALRAVDRRLAGHPARHRRHLLGRRRHAADVAAGLRGPDRPHHERHRPDPQRHHGNRPGRPEHGPRRRRRQAPGGLEDRAGRQRAAGQEDRLHPGRVRRRAQLRPGRRHDRRAEGALRRHHRRGRDDGADHRRRPERAGDRHAGRQPHRGGLAAVLRPPGRPAVPHGGGDPVLAEGAALQPPDGRRAAAA